MESINSCGQALKQRFGFPDAVCPDESPLSEIDVATLPRHRRNRRWPSRQPTMQASLRQADAAAVEGNAHAR